MHRRSLFRLFWVLVLLLTGGYVSRVGTTLAQDNIAYACVPVDVVILLDQSDSMSLNDTESLRIDSVRNVIDILYENAALMCSGTTHRIGVVGFGSDAKVLVKMTEIRVDDPNSDWERDRDRLGAEIRSDQLGATSLREPLIEADLMFQTPIEDEVTRSRLLLILTDGAPCTVSASNLDDLPGINGGPCQSPEWLQHYILGNIPALQRYNEDDTFEEAGFDFPQGLQNFVESTATLGGATSLNVLLFSRNPSGDVPPSVDVAWRQVTAQRNGRYYSPTDLQNDQGLITVILEELIYSRTGNTGQPVDFRSENGECIGEIVLEPYSSSTTIFATTRPNNDDRVVLIEPDGTEITPTNTIVGGSEVRYNEGRTRQRFIVTNPMPGIWKLIDPTGVCSVRADTQKIPVVPSLIAPFDVVPNIESPYYVEGSQDFVNLTLRDSFNELFNQLPNHPLEITATIGVEAKSALSVVPTEKFTLSFEFIGAGVWRSTTPVPAPVRGSYSINVTAKIDSVVPSNPPIQIFTATGVYSTADPVSISLRAVTPNNGAVLPLNSLADNVQVDEPFGVAVEFIDSNEARQPYSSIFPRSADGVVVARLTNSSGQLLRQIMLSPSADDPYRLEGIFQKPDGDNSPDPAGSYSVTFALTDVADAQYNRENYVLEANSPAILFERRPLRGMRLLTMKPTADEIVMLNNIVDGIQTEIDIPVEVELVDQSNNPLTSSEVFTSDLNEIVTATLINPNGQEIQTIPLTQAGANRFSGVFKRTNVTGAQLQPEGEYTISFSFGDGNSTAKYNGNDFAYLSPSSTPVTFRRVEQHGIRPVLLTVAGASPAVRDAPKQYELNSVSPDGIPVPTSIVVTAVLADLDGNRYVDAELQDIVAANAKQVLRATITGPEDSNINESIWLTRTEEGSYTGALRDGLTVPDVPGAYTISLSVNPEAITSADQRYLLVSDTIQQPAYVERFSRIGIAMTVVALGGQEIADMTSAVQISMYASPIDALIGAIKPIPFTLRIYDTNSQMPLPWENVARTSTDGDSALTITDLVRVGVQGKDSAEAVSITDLTQEVLGDSSVVIRGEIRGIENTDNYVLFFGLDSDNLNNVTVVSFSDIERNRGALEFARAIIDPLTNPIVVRGVAIVVTGLLVGLLIWIWMVNWGLFSMRGEMIVTKERLGIQPVTDVIPLGFFSVFWTRSGSKTGAIVRRGKHRSNARPGLPSSPTPPLTHVRRSYDVMVDGRTINVPEGTEVQTFGYKVRHEHRTVSANRPLANPPR